MHQYLEIYQKCVNSKYYLVKKDLFHGYYSEEYKTYIKRNSDVFKGYNFKFLNNYFNKKKKSWFFFQDQIFMLQKKFINLILI